MFSLTYMHQVLSQYMPIILNQIKSALNEIDIAFEQCNYNIVPYYLLLLHHKLTFLNNLLNDRHPP